MSVPPPRGMSEIDYEAIEAAVTETVRGRWFLAEFARRNRMAETRQLLEAMARLETAVTGGQVALPSADPSIRLLVQRIKEIAAGLADMAGDMRASGVDERFVEAIEAQGRAVSGMMRGANPPLPGTAAAAAAPSRPPVAADPPPSIPKLRLPRAELPPALAQRPAPHTSEPRLAALAALDELPLAEKLAMFR